MSIAWGVVVIVLAAIAWLGQTVAWLAPGHAERWGLTESREAVEPTYHADIRGEALWDVFTLWTLLAAGVLLVAGHDAWPYFALVGGGIYVYFAGRGIVTRRVMQLRGLRIGDPANVRVNYLFLVMWGVVAAVTMIAGAVALAGG